MTVHRRLPYLLCLMALATGAASDDTLTAEEAVRLGFQHPDVAALWEASDQIARGRVESAGRWANPDVEYSRESLSLPSGDAEENAIWFRQQINLAGVHGLTREAARHGRRAADFRNDYAQREWAAEIRTRFYRALAARRDASLVERWHHRFSELTAAVAKRVKAGDASRYELHRLEQELALLEGERLRTRAGAASARDRLAQRTNDAQSPLSGRLLPPEAPPNAVPVAEHPLMRALSAEAESAGTRAQAAERRRWPDLTLGVGRKEVTEPGLRAEGNLISIGIEIPLFDRNSGEARTQRGLAQQRRADLALARAELSTQLRALQRSLSAQRQSALALQPNEDIPTESLASTAESSYAAGELSVTELIDAHRSELAARREALQRALSARETYIQLQRLTGDHP